MVIFPGGGCGCGPCLSDCGGCGSDGGVPVVGCGGGGSVVGSGGGGVGGIRLLLRSPPD